MRTRSRVGEGDPEAEPQDQQDRPTRAQDVGTDDDDSDFVAQDGESSSSSDSEEEEEDQHDTPFAARHSPERQGLEGQDIEYLAKVLEAEDNHGQQDLLPEVEEEYQMDDLPDSTSDEEDEYSSEEELAAIGAAASTYPTQGPYQVHPRPGVQLTAAAAAAMGRQQMPPPSDPAVAAAAAAAAAVAASVVQAQQEHENVEAAVQAAMAVAQSQVGDNLQAGSEWLLNQLDALAQQPSQGDMLAAVPYNTRARGNLRDVTIEELEKALQDDWVEETGILAEDVDAYDLFLQVLRGEAPEAALPEDEEDDEEFVAGLLRGNGVVDDDEERRKLPERRARAEAAALLRAAAHAERIKQSHKPGLNPVQIRVLYWQIHIHTLLQLQLHGLTVRDPHPEAQRIAAHVWDNLQALDTTRQARVAYTEMWGLPTLSPELLGMQAAPAAPAAAWVPQDPSGNVQNAMVAQGVVGAPQELPGTAQHALVVHGAVAGPQAPPGTAQLAMVAQGAVGAPQGLPGTAQLAMVVQGAVGGPQELPSTAQNAMAVQGAVGDPTGAATGPNHAGYLAGQQLDWTPVVLTDVRSVLDVAPLRSLQKYADAVNAYDMEEESCMQRLKVLAQQTAVGRKRMARKGQGDPLKEVWSHTLLLLRLGCRAHLIPALFYRTGPPNPQNYWLPGEDELLARGIQRFGGKWQLIRDTYLPTRKPEELKNRQKNVLQRKREGKQAAHPVRGARELNRGPLTAAEMIKLKAGLQVLSRGFPAAVHQLTLVLEHPTETADPAETADTVETADPAETDDATETADPADDDTEAPAGTVQAVLGPVQTGRRSRFPRLQSPSRRSGVTVPQYYAELHGDVKQILQSLCQEYLLHREPESLFKALQQTTCQGEQAAQPAVDPASDAAPLPTFPAEINAMLIAHLEKLPDTHEHKEKATQTQREKAKLKAQAMGVIPKFQARQPGAAQQQNVGTAAAADANEGDDEETETDTEGPSGKRVRMSGSAEAGQQQAGPRKRGRPGKTAPEGPAPSHNMSPNSAARYIATVVEMATANQVAMGLPPLRPGEVPPGVLMGLLASGFDIATIRRHTGPHLECEGLPQWKGGWGTAGMAAAGDGGPKPARKRSRTARARAAPEGGGQGNTTEADATDGTAGVPAVTARGRGGRRRGVGRVEGAAAMQEGGEKPSEGGDGEQQGQRGRGRGRGRGGGRDGRTVRGRVRAPTGMPMEFPIEVDNEAGGVGAAGLPTGLGFGANTLQGLGIGSRTANVLLNGTVVNQPTDFSNLQAALGGLGGLAGFTAQQAGQTAAQPAVAAPAAQPAGFLPPPPASSSLGANHTGFTSFFQDVDQNSLFAHLPKFGPASPNASRQPHASREAGRSRQRAPPTSAGGNQSTLPAAPPGPRVETPPPLHTTLGQCKARSPPPGTTLDLGRLRALARGATNSGHGSEHEGKTVAGAQGSGQRGSAHAMSKQQRQGAVAGSPSRQRQQQQQQHNQQQLLLQQQHVQLQQMGMLAPPQMMMAMMPHQMMMHPMMLQPHALMHRPPVAAQDYDELSDRTSDEDDDEPLPVPPQHAGTTAPLQHALMHRPPVAAQDYDELSDRTSDEDDDETNSDNKPMPVPPQHAGTAAPLQHAQQARLPAPRPPQQQQQTGTRVGPVQGNGEAAPHARTVVRNSPHGKGLRKAQQQQAGVSAVGQAATDRSNSASQPGVMNTITNRV